jgi:hypothetical protein
MRRVLVAVFALALFLAAVAAGSAGTGNGAPSGPHYNLNLIGVANGKTATDTSNSNGRRIFVPLSGRSRILLTEGPFDVLDYDGTDGEASFQLPNPDPDLDGTTDYSVYVARSGSPAAPPCSSPASRTRRARGAPPTSSAGSSRSRSAAPRASRRSRT